MSITAAFEAFLCDEVNLNQGRLDRLQSRVDAVEGFLTNNASFGDLFRDLVPAGSWAHRTIIKPVAANDEFDADVLLLVASAIGWQPKDYLESLYAAFTGSDRYKQLAVRKTRCVRLNYAGDFHLDVVPYLERNGQHVITNRLEPPGRGRYEASNPEAFTAWMDERERFSNQTFITVVRLLKYLRDYKNTFTCRSIILTTLLGAQLDENDSVQHLALFSDVPTALHTLLRRLADDLPATMPKVMDPAGTGDDFAERYHDSWNYPNFRKMMTVYADKVGKALAETDLNTALGLWQEVFGSTFGRVAVREVSAARTFSAMVPYSGEQFINRPPFGFPVRLHPSYRITVRGRCLGFHAGNTTRRQGFRQFDLRSKGNRVPKNRKLSFTASIDGPTPYDIYWKVRNGGAEAASVGQLRGEITQGSTDHEERTSYQGSHYVDCYVVKDGIVVAKDRQTVIVY